MKINRLLKRADRQVGGEEWIKLMASDRIPCIGKALGLWGESDEVGNLGRGVGRDRILLKGIGDLGR